MINSESTFRVIQTGQKTAKENMAIDESLLLNYNRDDKAIFRVYSWTKNSLTIGISQDFSNYTFLKDFKGNCAKRVTGGGVLFHGHDLSYSLVIPVELLDGLNIKESYEKICTFILKFYKKLGLNVCYAKDNEQIQLSKSEYCQVGFEAYDILVNGQKIGGNAQRRTKKAIFQHGSIPIRITKSNTFDERIGLTLEDIGVNISFEEAEKLLIESFNDSFNVVIENSKLTQNEKNKKELLLKDKYDYGNN